MSNWKKQDYINLGSLIVAIILMIIAGLAYLESNKTKEQQVIITQNISDLSLKYGQIDNLKSVIIELEEIKFSNFTCPIGLEKYVEQSSTGLRHICLNISAEYKGARQFIINDSGAYDYYPVN